ncbi:MAG: hypothetical protein WCA30_16465 [Dermatophilaceae bacterium]
MSARSPFLAGALAWLYTGEQPRHCPGCGYDWSIDTGAALESIASSARQYPALLDGRDGMVPAADGGWNATAYLWHLTDLARSWSERWVQLAAAPGALLAGWDPDVLAEARNYRSLPTVPALWALSTSTATFVALGEHLPPQTPFLHGDWGRGTVADGTRWLGHEFVHHLLDVDARASGTPM